MQYENMDSLKFFSGSIKTKGKLYGPLMGKEFFINYHFSDTAFKYEYVETNNESGLIINYSSKAVTLYAREYNIKRKFTTSLSDFEVKFDSLNFFKDCVNRLYSKIKIPEFIGEQIDYGQFEGVKFNLINYKDKNAKLDIYDLKLKIPGYVTRIAFKELPKEVRYFPLINRYKRELGWIEKILLKLSEIAIESIEIIDLEPNIFEIKEGYETVDKIGYSKSDYYDKENHKRPKSIFDMFDD
ncbi:MAG: hypothetical protein JW870_03470 [Candidatus Delongbacteria bacterium]|nr:hypothetical protein [Candidatus Delongbacteria bacterium]